MNNTAIHIQPADRIDFAQIAQLIARQNGLPRYRCLHSDEGSAAGVLFTMNKWADEEAIAFVYALNEADQIVGAFGAEFDSDQRRGWLWGPFAEEGDADPDGWLALCERMYGQLMAILPFEPALLDGFIDQPFELGARLYETCGHHHAKTVYVFVAPRPADSPAANISLSKRLSRLTPAFADGFATLFDAIFQDTFYTGAQVVERLNTERLSEQEQVFIYTQGDAVLGFCHASVNRGANEGYIEFVGVDEEARGRGIGRKLLQTTMHWLFEEQAMPKIGLTTGDDNVNAHALYRGLGFQLEHTGLAYRKHESEQR